MKLITTFALMLITILCMAQNPFKVDFQIEFPEGVEYNYEDVEVFVTFDRAQRNFDVSKKGEIGFHLYPQTNYEIMFTCPGYVTKSVGVYIEDLTYNIRQKHLNFKGWIVEMEPRVPEKGFKLYTQPNLTFQYVENRIESLDVTECYIDIKIDDSYTYVIP